MSIGLGHYPGQAVDLDGLMQQADIQLYRAKGCGRNRVVAAFKEAETSYQ
jgi:GGDEF domain-containing protein